MAQNGFNMLYKAIQSYFKQLMTITSLPAPRDILAHWDESGRNHFTMPEFRSALGGSEKATHRALSRLLDTREIASPAKGFYVIVPPGHRARGCLPASEFIAHLMGYWKMPYYAGGLTASLYHGAAHQIPQGYQIVVSKHVPEIICRHVGVSFIVRRNIASIPVTWLKGSRCWLPVSTVEATAFDLVGHMMHETGSLDRVAGMVCELAEEMSPKLLAEAAEFSPIAWAQRLGYLLEYAEADGKAALLKEHVRQRARSYTPLAPCEGIAGAVRSKEWKVLINCDIDMEE